MIHAREKWMPEDHAISNRRLAGWGEREVERNPVGNKRSSGFEPAWLLQHRRVLWVEVESECGSVMEKKQNSTDRTISFEVDV